VWYHTKFGENHPRSSAKRFRNVSCFCHWQVIVQQLSADFLLHCRHELSRWDHRTPPTMVEMVISEPICDRLTGSNCCWKHHYLQLVNMPSSVLYCSESPDPVQHISFYRAMLCIRSTSRGPVSVSVTSRSSTKTAKRMITQTTPHDSPGTLVFWRQRSPQNSTGVTPYEGAKCRWGGQNRRLSTNNRLYLENGTR